MLNVIEAEVGDAVAVLDHLQQPSQQLLCGEYGLLERLFRLAIWHRRSLPRELNVCRV
jgi:hypothetical protein